MDMAKLIADSFSRIDGMPISSVSDMRRRASDLMTQAHRVWLGGHNIPISYYFHTGTSIAGRFVPNMPKELIPLVSTQLVASRGDITAVFMLSEAWALRSEGGELELANQEAREWIESGRPISEHPDAADVMIVSGMMNVSGYGKTLLMGMSPLSTEPHRVASEPNWDILNEGKGALMPETLFNAITVVEDAEFLRQRAAEPRPGRYETASSDWSA